ncbi:hypothetical protein MAALD49_36780 [Marinobacter shengliensis]|nr:hypothetical protein MAALD49_36780 [Marinobacter shengliensis]
MVFKALDGATPELTITSDFVTLRADLTRMYCPPRKRRFLNEAALGVLPVIAPAHLEPSGY